MKRVLFAVAFVAAVSSTQAQDLKGLIKSVTSKKDSTGTSSSSTDISSALKQALTIGAQKGASQLSAVNGFFGNAAVKILMPPEAQKAEKTLRSMGLNKQVDDAILAMNRAAEDAAKSAAPIFVDAIKQMSIQDAVGILKGSDTAATVYLKSKTTTSLTKAFKPTVDSSLGKVDATKYWTTLTTAYNKIPFTKKMETDLTAYVTDRALSGLFYEVGQQEKLIRKDPVAQTTDLLKQVFGGLGK
ncbi:DUF4197 domain-containing protein [Chitinophagaceae bacterium LWZ2-11]